MKHAANAAAPGSESPIDRTESFISPEAAGRSLGLSKCTVLRWAKQGRLTAYKPSPRTILFDPREVAAVVRASRVPSTSQGGAS